MSNGMDNERKWRIYLGLSEVSKALLCGLAMALAPRRLQPAAFMSLVWFATQAQQEFMGLNDGTTETREYWLVAAMALAIAIQLALTRR